jgi:KaiC/GvpD/RAD55 family RecA-like ATPase
MIARAMKAVAITTMVVLKVVTLAKTRYHSWHRDRHRIIRWVRDGIIRFRVKAKTR